MVGVIRPGVIFKSVDIAVAKTSHRTPTKVVEVNQQIGRDAPHVAIDVLGYERPRIQRRAIWGRDGLDVLIKLLQKGKTYCFLGSSGVGKSTLINNLAGKDLMRTNSISDSTKKGRHVTSHREMVILKNGGILIDNPGMREIGLADASGGLETAFEQITELSSECKFSDCRHINENGCAVVAAVENGDLERAAYDNYLKLEREKIHFQSSIAEKRKKDKEIGKMIKDYKKTRKQNEW